MKYRKEDLPKIIVLSVILAAAVVWAVVANVKAIRQSRARAEAMESAAGERAAADLRAARAETPLKWAGLLTPVPPPSRDPFDPVIAPRWQRERRAAPKQTKPAATPRTLPPMPGSSDSALHLAGIIHGQPTVAVIRRGEDSFIVEEGQYLEGGLRVESIAVNRIRLRDRNGTYTLRLGE